MADTASPPMPASERLINALDKKKLETDFQYMAMNSSGKALAVLDIKTRSFNIRRIEANWKAYHELFSFDGVPTPICYPSDGLDRWSIAISDFDETGNFSVALSCLETSRNAGDRKKTIDQILPTHSQYGEERLKTQLKDMTHDSTVILICQRKRLKEFFFINYGGVVKFVTGSELAFAEKLIIMGRQGFCIGSVNELRAILCEVQEDHCDETTPLEVKQRDVAQIYLFPRPMESLLDNLEGNSFCAFLDNCIHQKFLNSIDSRNNIEVFSLVKGRFKFSCNSPDYNRNASVGIPIFARSSDDKYFAVSVDNNTIVIYLLENTLEIAVERIDELTKEEGNLIRFIGFCEKDTKLFILVEQNNMYRFFFWDLFTSSLSYIQESNVKTSKVKWATHPYKQPFVQFQDQIVAFTNDKQVVLLEEIMMPKTEPRIAEFDESINIMLDDKKTHDLHSYEPWFRPKSQVVRHVKQLFHGHQLVVGMQTIQIWKKDSDDKERLLYIWRIPKELEKATSSAILRAWAKETKFTAITEKEEGPFDGILGEKSDDVIEHVEDTIWEQPTSTYIQDAADALVFLQQQRKLAKDGDRCNKIGKIIGKVATIIFEFAERSPNQFRLLDSKYHIVAALVEARCADQIMDILDSRDEHENPRNLHIPQLDVRDKKLTFLQAHGFQLPRKESELTLAIKTGHPEIVEHLLNYYKRNTAKNAGWMFTVTQELPTIFEKYPRFAHKFFDRKSFISAKEISLDPWHNHQLAIQAAGKKAFTFVPNLYLTTAKSEKKLKRHSHLDDDLKVPFYRMVPLPNITVSPKANILYGALTLGNAIQHRSPFSKLILLDPTGKIFKNPAIEAVINYTWEQSGKLSTWLAFGFSIVFSVFFVWLCHLHLEFIVYNNHSGFYLPGWIITTYTSGLWLFIQIQRMQFHRGPPWLAICFWFESAVIALCFFVDLIVVVVYFQVSTQGLAGHTSYCSTRFDICRGQVSIIAFACLGVWSHLFLRMRFLPRIGEYILILCQIVVKLWLFLASQTFVITGYGIAMYMILRFIPDLGLTPILQNYNITSNGTTILKINEDFDSYDVTDNRFFNAYSSIEGAYSWILGQYDVLLRWDFVPIHIIVILASIILVTIMQNMLIALMSDVVSTENNRESKHYARMQTRAQFTVDYGNIAALWTYWSKQEKPRYIYYQVHHKPEEDQEPFIQTLQPSSDVDKNKNSGNSDNYYNKSMDNSELRGRLSVGTDTSISRGYSPARSDISGVSSHAMDVNSEIEAVLQQLESHKTQIALLAGTLQRIVKNNQ
ncbi:7327_t:CDS:2 [Ambispora gerdemannii]|uniref:7327_t:CDS:1 n=1 Tax=Ambispora gerdemannii TaxID=144530 RepID=A0A9N8VHS7_9GLOM|nr:7327_t:CDS:2 [Ambispora gerdemannii]